MSGGRSLQIWNFSLFFSLITTETSAETGSIPTASATIFSNFQTVVGIAWGSRMGGVTFGVGLFPIEPIPRMLSLIKLAEDAGFSCAYIGDSQMIWREPSRRWLERERGAT